MPAMSRWLVFLLFPAALLAQTPAERVHDLVESAGGGDAIKTSIGVTRAGTPIPALLRAKDLDPADKTPRVLVVAGLDGSPESVDAAMKLWGASGVQASVVPVVNPDGWGRGPGNGAGGDPAMGYPPEGPSYLSPTDPEKQYLWRWIGLDAPDLVIEIAKGEQYRWLRSSLPQLDRLAAKLGAQQAAPQDRSPRRLPPTPRRMSASSRRCASRSRATKTSPRS